MSYIDDKVFQKALENLKNEFDTKVDKDGNKVLSDNNFTDDLKEKLENEVLVEEDLKNYVKNSDYATDVTAGVVKIGEGLSIDTNGILSADAYSQEEINELLDSKVNIEEGKSLVDDSEIERLATLENYDDTSVLQSIQDLEEGKVDKDGDKVLSDNNFTDEFKEKLEKIESEANKYELPEATETVLGGITIGEGLTKDADKNLTVAAATSEKIGGIKLGETLKIDANTGKVNVDSEKVAETFATKEYVDDAIDELPNPMIFQGSVGDGGTVSALPEISEDNIGWTYKAISDGDNYKVGDTLISNGTEWVVIPSGDEPDGTVTNVGLSVPTGFKVKGDPVTSSGNLEFEFDEGYELPTTEKLNSYQVKKLITEWGNETSDENYPSEKLVKDSLDKKVNDDSYATTEKAGIVQVGKGLEITDSGLLNITGLETVAISKREYDEEDRSVDNIVYFIEDIDNYPGGADVNFSFSTEQLETLNSGITGLDKAKLDGIDFNANKYVLPTANKDIVGGVTTTSEVEDSEGYIACPIIDGVPYYKEGSIVDGGDDFVLEKAGADKLGGVMIGNNITIDSNGKISVADPYTLEKASKTNLGGIIVGDNLTIDNNGVLSAAAPYSLEKASSSNLGGVKIGDNINIDNDGKISVAAPYSLEKATKSSLGGVVVGDNINVDSNGKISVAAPYTLGKASKTNLGGVIVGDNINVDSNGTISLSEATSRANGLMSPSQVVKLGLIDDQANHYELPKATTSTLGGVAIGSNISIDSTGKISVAAPYTLPKATTSALGGVIIGSNISVDSNGKISVAAPYTLPKATKSGLGGVIVGDNISVDTNGKISVAAPYSLSKATTSTLGGVIVGSNIGVDSSGKISISKDNVTTALGYTPATTTTATPNNNGLMTGSYVQTLNIVSSAITATNIGSAYKNASSTIGTGAVVLGRGVTASGIDAHAEGYQTIASGESSHAQNESTTASGKYSHAEGKKTVASGQCSHAAGYLTKASYDAVTVVGRKNNENTRGLTSLTDTSSSAKVFMVGGGNGTDDGKVGSTVMTVDLSGAIDCTTVRNDGVDYAEYFEWEDGNPNDEDRRGHFVTFSKGRKVRIANENDKYILGIVSTEASVVGGSYSENWQGRYLKDIYGDFILETTHHEAEYDEEGNLIHEAYDSDGRVENPNFDQSKPYISRSDRKEWVAVGMLGQLVVIDDGTCEEGSFCKVAAGGTATSSDIGYYVMERLDDNHIKILYR